MVTPAMDRAYLRRREAEDRARTRTNAPTRTQRVQAAWRNEVNAPAGNAQRVRSERQNREMDVQLTRLSRSVARMAVQGNRTARGEGARARNPPNYANAEEARADGVILLTNLPGADGSAEGRRLARDRGADEVAIGQRGARAARERLQRAETRNLQPEDLTSDPVIRMAAAVLDHLGPPGLEADDRT
jgi:hypothetical protein